MIMTPGLGSRAMKVAKRPDIVRASRSRCQRLPDYAVAACQSSAQLGVARLGAVWTCGLGWVTVESRRFPGGEGLATIGLKTLRGTRRASGASLRAVPP